VRGLLLLAIILAACVPGSGALAQSSNQDDEIEYAVQLVYAIPQDGEDRELDLDGTIHGTVESAQDWLDEETDGRRVNMVVDEDGIPTIERLELTRTDEELSNTIDSDASYQIEYEARAAGFNEPGILYAIYYEGVGESREVCGATPSPEFGPGNSFTLFLHSGCEQFSFVGADEDADFWELTFMHELFHALGAVERCAPNGEDGHINDPSDLMFGEAEPWDYPVHLDVDRDDYYGHGRSACYDIARSPYLTPNGDDPEPFPTPFTDVAMAGCQREADVPTSDRPDSEVWIFNLQEDPVDVEWLGPDGDTENIGTIDGWSGMILTSVPGDAIQVVDEKGDCLGGFEMPDFLDIGVVWVYPA
jgi:hypothetical protein